MKIALDAMGGDFGPPNLVAGAVMALRDYKQISKLYLVGDSAKIENELANISAMIHGSRLCIPLRSLI